MAGETAESLACHYGMNPRDELYMSVFMYRLGMRERLPKHSEGIEADAFSTTLSSPCV